MRNIKPVIYICLFAGIVIAAVRLSGYVHISTVRAFGDLDVDFGVPAGTPVFDIPDMAPGDPPYIRHMPVRNNGTLPRMVAVKGIRTGGTTELPVLEHILGLRISVDGTVIYGGTSAEDAKTVEQFFAGSDGDGILLGVLPAGVERTYTFTVQFPSDAGDPYQGKSVIFDLTYGIVTADHIVINEVFYEVDPVHGQDSPKDRNVKNGNSHEWIELYNPTLQDVSLKNWTITDVGITVRISPNKIIKAGGFALVSKDASQWKYWNSPKDAQTIELGSVIGDGLDNTGDHIILSDTAGIQVDAMGYGSDTAVFTSGGVPLASTGYSLARIAPGYDTDAFSDWMTNAPGSPGK